MSSLTASPSLSLSRRRQHLSHDLKLDMCTTCFLVWVWTVAMATLPLVQGVPIFGSSSVPVSTFSSANSNVQPINNSTSAANREITGTADHNGGWIFATRAESDVTGDNTGDTGGGGGGGVDGAAVGGVIAGILVVAAILLALYFRSRRRSLILTQAGVLPQHQHQHQYQYQQQPHILPPPYTSPPKGYIHQPQQQQPQVLPRYTGPPQISSAYVGPRTSRNAKDANVGVTYPAAVHPHSGVAVGTRGGGVGVGYVSRGAGGATAGGAKKKKGVQWGGVGVTNY
ncbi:hypothetical protein IAU59_003733 [Kwoniella sp. CBS 9459]